MRLYPEQRGARLDAVARDLATVLALVLFALIALKLLDQAGLLPR